MNYWTVDAFCFMLGIWSLGRFLLIDHYSCSLLALAWIWFYPLPPLGPPRPQYQSARHAHHHPHRSLTLRLPPRVQHVALGSGKSHPFDSFRYARVYEQIVEKGLLRRGD
jgi:hypothetical protein